MNQAAYLGETLRSVLAQGYPDLEYFVVDGGSSDGSVEIIREASARLAWWVSESDSGQVDAITKGLQRATGQVIAFLNSDDLYLPGALQAVAAAFQAEPSVDWIAGPCLMFGGGRPTELHRPVVPEGNSGWLVESPLAQPAVFLRRSTYERLGPFDHSLHYAFDWEYWIRLAFAGVRCRVLTTPLAAFRFHSDSKSVSQPESFLPEISEIRHRYMSRLPWSQKAALRRWLSGGEAIAAAQAAGAAGDWASARRAWTRVLHLRPGALLERRNYRPCLRSLAGIAGYTHTRS
jgi:glycosyltransferase involved in cell wall biosynthesis